MYVKVYPPVRYRGFIDCGGGKAAAARLPIASLSAFRFAAASLARAAAPLVDLQSAHYGAVRK